MKEVFTTAELSELHDTLSCDLSSPFLTFSATVWCFAFGTSETELVRLFCKKSSQDGKISTIYVINKWSLFLDITD